MEKKKIRYIGPRDEVACEGHIFKKDNIDGIYVDADIADKLLSNPSWYEEVIEYKKDEKIEEVKPKKKKYQNLKEDINYGS